MIDAVIIGAGVLGCAVAERLSATYPDRDIWVLEQGPRIAEGVTSRNSGVIHAGIYYPPQSLKAQSCIRGAQLLYEWCREKSVPHRKTSKWIVGSLAEKESLEWLLENARLSGVTNLRRLRTEELSGAMGGVLAAEIGLESPDTGIVDPYLFSRSLQESAESRGVQFVMSARVSGIESLGNARGFRLDTERGEIEAQWVINTAGLSSDQIDAMVRPGGQPLWQIYPWRGDYYRIRKQLPIDRLIYPLKKKTDPGLGIHLTLDLSGGLRLGPDVAYNEDRREDFAAPVNESEKKKVFFEKASHYLRGLQLDDLFYDSCGIRPKLRSPDDKSDPDFVIDAQIPGFVSCLGIESPGLTASLDLADRVVKKVT